MGVEAQLLQPAPGPISQAVSTVNTENMVPIDAPRAKPAAAQQAGRLRLVEEDLARLQDQLMDVLEENQQLRTELEGWRASARATAQQAS